MRRGDRFYSVPAAREAANGLCSDGGIGRDGLAYRRRRRNPWGRKVDELLARKTMTLRELAERVKEIGYSREHPYKAINRFQQPEHWKVDMWLFLCVEDALELNEEESAEYWHAMRETGRWARREGLI